MILLGAAILMFAPLFHIVFPKSNPVVDAYENDLDAKVWLIDQQVEKAHNDYKNGAITGDEAYSLIFHDLLPKRSDQIKINEKLLEKKEDSERIFGWKTWRSFWNGWGQRLPYVVFVLSFSFLFFAFNIKDRLLYWSLIFFQLAGYTMTTYQQAYSFWPAQDIPIKGYRLTIFSIGLFMGTSIILFMKYYFSKTNLYMEIIRMLNGVLIKDVKPYVKNEREYEEEIMWPTLKNERDALKQG
ncbi:hypothetical protein J0X14_14370 [Muricauda sp. CAU 1633]|uniref:hypothetical protein n=1 Tax=Allomuricauda sp. CAU 1633 TaxID=2816036 RepID=UPI001A8EC4C2|nr:hypothetical protein [Muricauda sp. CAU 1633]MBO0323490.1 hypothetical protein [Muricauda sp. CAU 1633]